MREIVMDTETTGLDPNSGDRIVEIGAVELFNHMPTGKTYHKYINPQRDMPDGAFAVHGLSAEFLSDKPLFADVAQAFLDFVGDSKLVIHNAAFDMKFLNAELKWVERPEIPWAQALDTLAASYAESGRFAEAVKSAEEAIRLAIAKGDLKSSQSIQERLSLYRRNQPYHGG